MAMSIPIRRLQSALGLGHAPAEPAPELPEEMRPSERKAKTPSVSCPKCQSRCSSTSHRCGNCGRRLMAAEIPRRSGPELADPAKPVEDERPAPVVGGYRELSLLSDLQLQILVSARHDDPRGQIRVCAAPEDTMGVAAGTERFEGPQAIEAVKLLLGSGYLERMPPGTLSLTAHALRLAELARTSPALAARLRRDR